MGRSLGWLTFAVCLSWSAPAGASIDRARDWLKEGRYALGRGEIEEARRCYERALALEPRAPEIVARVTAWNADLEAHDGRFAAALEGYRRALEIAEPGFKEYVMSKRSNVELRQTRARCKQAAWTVLLLCVAGWLVRARFRLPRSIPGGLLYLVPVATLMVLACPGPHEDVRAALIFMAAGAACLTLLVSAAVERKPLVRLWDVVLHVSHLMAGTAALLYLAIARGTLLDQLINTLTTRAPVVG
jgi:tetratricopeptide (TPR) repeat protein